MKITLRLITSLIFVSTSVAAVFSYLQFRTEKLRLTNDLQRRVEILSDNLKESLEPALEKKDGPRLSLILERAAKRENLAGILLLGETGTILAESSGVPADFKNAFGGTNEIGRESGAPGRFELLGGRKIYGYGSAFDAGGESRGLWLFQDASYIDGRLKGIWHRNFLRLLVQVALIVLTTLLVVRWSVTGPIAQAAEWIKHLRMGEVRQPPRHLRGDILGPLAAEVSQMARSLESARAAAEKEAQLRLSNESLWTPEKLKEHVRAKLGSETLFVISNREPYMHVRRKKKVECIVPASGLVTALEPVMRACGGMWLAHGSGDADRETCDDRDRVRVPPDEPAYVLKRVWLTKEEEDGHYYGFSNEGLWPLCHITHTRPEFHLEDWVQYQRVNQKFADALLEEIKDEQAPLVLIQDYHFALLPLLIREKRPDARIALFWHIPWPNPESFGICPWKQEILLGMLSADIVGFHIQFHCNNFLDTVDNTIECKINREQFAIERGGHTTQVKPFPISVGSFAESLSEAEGSEPGARALFRETIIKEHGITAQYLGVGVDRLDYTKGILERFRAIERFLDKYPEYQGRFTFAQLGAPSRTHIQKYHDFIAEVERTADAINWKFQTKDWKPIVFLKEHHSHATILPFYKASDLCLVTSLHDGMNLVAKEFVSSRDDEDGVLVLSQFTGASRELKDALIVNPYDLEATADCIRLALEMPEAQRRERMSRMRLVVKDRNIYRWAANLISAIAQLPSRKTESPAGA